jgi:surfeit locus 1 family protein
LVVPALSTLLMFVVLVCLGVWQVHRLSWKQALLAAIDQAEASPAVDLPAVPRQFQKVRIAGRLRPDLVATYGAQVVDTSTGPVMGAQLVMPLERPGLPDILVDRGWVPEHAAVTTPAGEVSVSGYVRMAERPGWFAATDDVAGRHFYTLDPAAIGRALGLRAVAPFTLVVLGAQSADTGAYPLPAQHLPRPPNDHLSYAITWFGLAAVLLVVFIAYSRKRPI